MNGAGDMFVPELRTFFLSPCGFDTSLCVSTTISMTVDGNDWGSWCTATKVLRNRYRNSGNLKDFLCRKWRRPPGLHGLEKRLYASSMPLVLSPSPEASKSGIAK